VRKCGESGKREKDRPREKVNEERNEKVDGESDKKVRE
jgi:hypothetical protein